jgi:putative copper resistance protein D
VTDFVEFAAVLLSGIALIGLALALGGAAFAQVVLARETARSVEPASPPARSLALVAIGAVTLAAARLAALFLLPLSFADDARQSPLRALFATGYAHATIAQASAAAVLAGIALSLRGRSATPRRRIQMPAAALLVLVCGAWLTHASSRVEGAGPLMAMTLLHQLGAALWVGGIAQLVLLRRQARARDADPSLWPRMLARFSPLALVSVLLLFAAGVGLAWYYVGDWSALFGTGYGAMVLAKIALLAVALFFASRNYLAVRRWRASGNDAAIERSVPAYVEAELAVVVCALLTAASLTSQPPAIDVPGEHATAAEVLAFLAPKKPVLVPPPREAFLAAAASTADTFADTSELEHVQNNFNHNISGLLVLIVAIAAALDRTRRVAFARHWPLAFLTLAVFVVVFAEPTVWPLGPESFWTTLAVPAVLQHRLAVLLVVGLALFEWRVRVGGLASTRWRYVFPLLCLCGGAMLLTHSHTIFATREVFLIELSHAIMGLLAVLVGIGRWLELRLPAPQSRMAGAVWTLCLMGVGFVLLFYREG